MQRGVAGVAPDSFQVNGRTPIAVVAFQSRNEAEMAERAWAEEKGGATTTSYSMTARLRTSVALSHVPPGLLLQGFSSTATATISSRNDAEGHLAEARLCRRSRCLHKLAAPLPPAGLCNRLAALELASAA